jgi:CHAT domain-containing protein
MIEKAFPRSSAIEIERVQRGDATRRSLLAAFRSGRYDVIHYAGHAQFDPEQPSLSGILCAGNEVLTGADLAGLAKLPFLVFFNACESGRVRGTKRQIREVQTARNQAIAQPGDRVRALIERNVGLAEAFMRGGAANYVGTYWPVGDEAAAAFAEVFYSRLSAGETLGTALRDGRKVVHGKKSVDWADYIHYGASDFRLKTGPGAIRERKPPPPPKS